MKQILIRRRGLTGFVASITVTMLVMGGGVAVANIPSSTTGTYTACVNKTTGATRVIDAQRGKTCTSNEQVITWTKGYRYRNTWSPTISYSAQDVVTTGGSAYVAKMFSLNRAPASNTTAWGLLAARGAVGPKGLTGVQGLTGVHGDAGAQGLTGVQGDAGAQGLTGAKGDAGAKGDPGAQGLTGATGPTGPPGPRPTFNKTNQRTVDAGYYYSVYAICDPGTVVVSGGFDLRITGGPYDGRAADRSTVSSSKPLLGSITGWQVTAINNQAFDKILVTVWAGCA